MFWHEISQIYISLESYKTAKMIEILKTKIIGVVASSEAQQSQAHQLDHRDFAVL